MKTRFMNLTTRVTIYLALCLAIIVAQSPPAEADPKAGKAGDVLGQTDFVTKGDATIGTFSFGVGGFNDRCQDEFGAASYFCTCQQAANQPNISDITVSQGAWCRHVSAGSGLMYNPDTDTYFAHSTDVTGVSDFHENANFILALSSANMDCSGWELDTRP